MPLGSELQPVEHHAGCLIPAHGIDRQGECLGQGRIAAGKTGVTPGVTSNANGVLQRLASRDHFPAIVMAAVAADMMRALQLAAIAALGMRFDGKSLMAATHAPARGRRLSFRNSHDTKPFSRKNTSEPRRLADHPRRRKADITDLMVVARRWGRIGASPRAPPGALPLDPTKGRGPLGSIHFGAGIRGRRHRPYNGHGWRPLIPAPIDRF